MKDNRRLYFFYRDSEDGYTAKMIDQHGEESTRRRLREQTCNQIIREGYPIPEDWEPVVVLPYEWVGELEALKGTSVSTLMHSIEWYFKEKGLNCKISPFAYREGTSIIRQFWVGFHAVLPVWASEEPSAGMTEEDDPEQTGEKADTDEPVDEIVEQADADEADEETEAAVENTSKAPEKKKDEESVSRWRDVCIFISSTFNDMHAERNYLVKRVFPELSQWCARHRLRLRDIDLRWGITEEDSQENRRTVEICLENIDRCRPFFLCFIGQRRGWVPSDEDIARKTFDVFPKLKDNIGSSVTEMEVIHSLIDPMRRNELSDEDQVERAFFYLRDDAYLSDVRPDALAIYTNAGSDDPAHDDRLLDRFRDKTIPGTGRPYRHYSCRWDENGRTAELAAIKGAPADIVRGALTDFTYKGRPLSEQIIEDLKSAITERFHLSDELSAGSPLDKELEEQSLFLYTAGEGFIEREGDLEPFERYVSSGSTKPLILTAPAGMGKSSLLAHWIIRADHRIFYRFIGRSKDASSAPSLIDSIWRQLYEAGKIKEEPPQNTGDLFEGFSKMLADAAKDHKLILVLDAIDQLPAGVNDVAFLPQKLAPNVKLIISVKEDAPDADRYLAQAGSYAEIVRVRPLSDTDDRSAMVETYLSNYLKKLSADQQRALVSARGADNPLYLKIVLSELRVFGAYDALQSHIEEDFGDTPQSAFEAVLHRLEGDSSFTDIPTRRLIESVFGWMSHTRGGMEPRELAAMLVNSGVAPDLTAALDTVYILLRQLKPFLTERDQKTDFFYDSFKEACIRRYTKEKSAEQWHRELACYLATKPADDAHRLSEQAYQYAAAEMTKEYLDYVMDYTALSMKLRTMGARAGVEDYRLVTTPETARMEAFFGLAGAVLASYPDQLGTRLIGHLMRCGLKRIKDLLASAEKQQQGTWLRPLNPCFEEPTDADDLRMSTREKMEISVALLRDNSLAATVSDDEIIIWELENGSVELRIPAPKDKYFCQVAATSDGERLVASLRSGASGFEILVYDARTFRCTLRFDVRSGIVHYYFYGMLYFRPSSFHLTPDDSALLIAAGGDICIYSLKDGKKLAETQYRWNANSSAVSENGIIAVANIHPQNNEKEFDLSTFERIKNPVYFYRFDREAGTLKPYGKPVGEWRSSLGEVALSPDGTLLVGSDGVRTVVWDIRTGKKIKELDNGEVRVMRFLKKRNLFLAAGRSFTLYDAKSFEPVREIPGLGYCNSAAVSADESFAVLRLEDSRIRVISLKEESGDDASYSAPAPIRSVCLSRCGRYVYASCYDNFVESGKERTAGRSDKPMLYVFDRNTGERLNRLRLAGRYNRDFTYLTPDGSAAVSKNFQEEGFYIIRWWPLPDDPLTTDRDLYCDPCSIPNQIKSDHGWPEDIRFSYDKKYVVVNLHNEYTYAVYRVKTGRLMGTVHLKDTTPAKGWKRLFRKKEDDPEDDSISYARFDVTAEGTILHVLIPYCYDRPQAKRLEQYDIENDRRLSSFPLFGECPEYYPSHNYNEFCRVLEDDSIEFVGDSTALAVSALGTVRFSVDKEKESFRSDDYFAACSDNGRYLALSGKRRYGDTNWQLRVYDTEKARLIAAFTADGVIGEIVFEDDRTLLFGMGNGRICRLRLTQGAC